MIKQKLSAGPKILLLFSDLPNTKKVQYFTVRVLVCYCTSYVCGIEYPNILVKVLKSKSFVLT